MQAQRVLIAALVAVVIIAACAPKAPAPPPPPAIPELDRPGTAVLQRVSVGAIIEQALEPVPLRALLQQAGFLAGAERSWSNRSSDVWMVTVRALRFASPEGAGRYDSWLEVHGAELIGGGVAAHPLGHMGALVRHHEPGGCCPNKDTTWYLSAWREGSVEWLVFVGGPGADRAAVSDVVEAVA